MLGQRLLLVLLLPFYGRPLTALFEGLFRELLRLLDLMRVAGG